MAFTFQQRQPVRWHGRYRRIEGRESVFHVRADNTVDILWRDGIDEIICPAVMSASLRRLANAINAIKRRFAGCPGGAFIINEFGQVICPVPVSPWERYYVGDCSGAPVFMDADGNQFTLNNTHGLKTGDPWRLPYVGIVYNLSARNRIYFAMRRGIDTEFINPPRQDRNLINAIRSIRPSGSVRFIVNPHGIALTKVPNGHRWKPTYIGRIDYDNWFPKESE